MSAELTDAERELLGRALSTDNTLTHVTHDGPLAVAVESILADRRAAPTGWTREEWRINGPEGPAFAIRPDHPEAEAISRRVAATTPGEYVERRTVTTYPVVTTDWEQA